MLSAAYSTTRTALAFSCWSRSSRRRRRLSHRSRDRRAPGGRGGSGRLYADPGRGRPLPSLRPVRRHAAVAARITLVDTAVCLVCGFSGFRLTRARQMAQPIWLDLRARRARSAGGRRAAAPKRREPAVTFARFPARFIAWRPAHGDDEPPRIHSEGDFHETITRARPRRSASPPRWPAPPSAQIKIGVGGPLTGGSAAFGAQLKNGVEQAVADINAAGGILGQKIKLDRRRRPRRSEGGRLGRQQVRRPTA